MNKTVLIACAVIAGSVSGIAGCGSKNEGNTDPTAATKKLMDDAKAKGATETAPPMTDVQTMGVKKKGGK